MLYRPPTPTVNSITGRNIAHAHRTAVERALLAADLHIDNCRLVKPTIKQAATVLGVCELYVAAASRIAHDEQSRAAVLAGHVPLMVAAWSETLADRYERASPSERIMLAHDLGAERAWDELVVPSL